MRYAFYIIWYAVSQLAFPESAGAVYPPEQNRKSIIRFSHKVHFENMTWLFCAQCHVNAEKSMDSHDNLLPAKEESCGKCHDVKDPLQCGTCHIEGVELEPFTNPDRELRFPHELHAKTLEVPCESCHGDMTVYDYAADNPKRLPEMAVCYTCHNDRHASMECELCHTALDNLKPAFHTAQYITEHKFSPAKGNRDCGMCHQESWCESCHEGAVLAGKGMTPVASHSTYELALEGETNRIISRQHEPNYRFMHPLDAKGRERRCRTCHDYESFCIECHLTEGLEIKPSWHRAPDWIISRTQGGRHGEYARRDIERCMACHEIVDDLSFSCIACHDDRRIQWK